MILITYDYDEHFNDDSGLMMLNKKEMVKKNHIDLIPTAPARSILLKVVLWWVRFAPQVYCFHNNVPDDGAGDDEDEDVTRQAFKERQD